MARCCSWNAFKVLFCCIYRTHLETGTAAVPRRNTGPGHVCDTVRRIASVHDQLSDTVELFNDCYSAHLIQSLTPLALFTIFAFFGLIHAYASNADEVTMRVVWNNIMYNVFFLTVILQLVMYASLVSSDVCRWVFKFYLKNDSILICSASK